MPTADTVYSTRFRLPELLERGRDNAISCPLYRSGQLVEPDSGTVSVYDSAGVAIVNAAAVTITSSIARYTIPAATLSGKALGEGWRVEWSLELDGVDRLYRNEAALVRAAAAPPITDLDLFERVSSLNPSTAAPISSLTTYQTFIDAAHVELQLWLLNQGRRPWLVLSPASLRQAYLLLTLALIFEDFQTRLNAAYADQARDWRRQYAAERDSVKLAYDATDSGQADATRRRAGRPTLWLVGRD